MQTVTHMKYKLLLAVFVCSLFCSPLRAGDYKPNIVNLTVDAVGQEFFPYGFYKRISNPTLDMGAQVFADFRPVKEIALGVGTEYLIGLNTSGFSFGSFDLACKIFPFPEREFGEFYLEGGAGLNFPPYYSQTQTAIPGHFHGIGGVGFLLGVDTNTAVDLGVQYDFYSPDETSSNAVRVKVGLCFGLGSDVTRILVKSRYLRKEPKPIPLWKIHPNSNWDPNDSLYDLSAKMYGDEDLFPLIVDANPQLWNSAFPFRKGLKVVIPPLPTDKGLLEAARNKANNEKAYLYFENLSEAAKNGWDGEWKGPATYVWRVGDTLTSVAQDLYGDEDLFPLLVDANKDRLVLPVNLQPGVKIIVPKPEISQINAIHEKSWLDEDPYLKWKNDTRDQAEPPIKTREGKGLETPE